MTALGKWQLKTFDTKGNLVSVKLDVKNPHSKEDIAHLPPERLPDSILQKEKRIADIMADIKALIAKQDV